MALASLTPRLRPDSASFDAWAGGLGPAGDRPPADVLAAGVEALGPDERLRITADCAGGGANAWRTVCAEDGELAETLLLQGAVLAGLHERAPIPEQYFRAVELHRETCERQVCALTVVLNPSDVWGLVETVEIDDASDGRPDRADELARIRWTPAHQRRLDLVLARLRAELPAAPPVARAVLEDALAAVDRAPALRVELGAALLDQAIGLLDVSASAA